MQGRKTGNYEFVERLGEGGVGEVYAASDHLLSRPVAIKSLRPELSNDRAFVERFLAEATNLARLNHPNITTLYTLHREGAELFMVMELVRGRTLEDILFKAGRLAVPDCLALIAQAADGLAYAHRIGIIHRDIKPANLMVTSDGMVKIMDFGIARVRGSERLTRQGHIVGTLTYMAPEQVRGQEGDERSDLYSLAIVLYEMLSGRPPFVADSEFDLLRAQVEATPAGLVEHVEDIDPALEAAVLKALAKDPAARYASVEEFSKAIGASQLRPESPAFVRERFASLLPQTSDEPLAGAAATVADRLNQITAAAVTAPPLPTVLPTQVAQQPPPADRQPSRKRMEGPVLALALGGIVFASALGYIAYDQFLAGPANVASPGWQPDANPQTPQQTQTAPAGGAPDAGQLQASLQDQRRRAEEQAVADAIRRQREEQAHLEEERRAREEAARAEAERARAAEEKRTQEEQAKAERELKRKQEELRRQQARAEQASPAIRGTFQGAKSTAKISVGGQWLELNGLVGSSDAGLLEDLRDFLGTKGNISCEPLGGHYQCWIDFAGKRRDLALQIVRNGVARAAGDAPPHYREAEAQARQEKVGVWGQ
jgi:tRNA A-37 threonylcarbamoyl transferase component Bud32